MEAFEATTTPQSERLLANTLGYPSSWHVVRVVKGEGSSQSFHDTIYAGEPKANADTYYNHLAAMNAAMKFKEGESTPYDDNGGQMLPIDQSVEILEGDEVEVYYDQDSAWYAATVKTVVTYKDDVRYSVKYKMDRSTQDNVCVDMIRFVKAGKKKRKPAAKAKAASAKAGGKTTTPKAKTTTKGKAASGKTTPKTKVTPKAKTPDAKSNKRKAAKSSPTKAKKKKVEKEEYIPDADGLHLAAEMGLPEGWTAEAKSKSRFVFLSPDGSNRFTNEKAVFAYLDELVLPAANDEVSVEVPVVPMVESDDPPWRTDGHDFLQKRVKYEATKGEFSFGTVTGWIAADDKDSEGNPGFISEKDGKPAALFHITFDADSTIASQDLEEFELRGIFVDEENS